MLRQLKTSHRLATTLCLLSLTVLTLVRIARGRAVAEASPTAALRVTLPRPPEPWRAELSWDKVLPDENGYVQVLRDGGRIELTLDPRLQQLTERALQARSTPYAAAVLLSVDDGRVLAMAGRANPRDGEPEIDGADLIVKPWAPAASVFKLVTAAALVDAGVGPNARVCYHDGVRSVEAHNLTTHKKWDRSCASLAYGVAKSQNAIIGRLAHENLDDDDLGRAARALGFGATLPFELAVAPSEARVPEAGSLAFARVAAGFWSTTLSPLHGAWLAATLARGGTTPPLRLVERVVDIDGNALRPEAPASRRVLDEATARAVGGMMVGTTDYGTARLGFHDRRSGRALLPGIAVAGKTGTLDRRKPYLAYSWFVGFAPADKPEVAVSVLLGNGEDWHVRAHQVAAELLVGYFQDAPSEIRVASR